MTFTLPTLPYAYDALEPHIDARTMEIHHGKHHNSYTVNFNNAIAGTDLVSKSIEEIFSIISNYSPAIKNNAGGFYNHSLFWQFLSPNGGGDPTGELATILDKTFGSIENFKKEFSKAAATRFGSGWAWLSVKKDGSLCICSTANQDNPLMDDAACKGIPILCLDVWEHAYYLNYQNRRPDYITAFWNVVNWNEVAKRYAAAK